MKLMIFGTGRYYHRRKEQITPETEIVAYIDNNRDLHGNYIDGIEIISPCRISQFSYNKILLMSAKAYEMKEQLIGLGVAADDIWYWEQYLSETVRGTIRFYCGNRKLGKHKKKILIISTDLNYNGGTIAAVYAAASLQNRGYYVILAAHGGNREFIKEITKEGINIVLCPSLPYLHLEEMCWIQQFDAVIVNVFQMIQCACEISLIRPVVWWIHEPSAASESIYPDTMRRFSQYANVEKMSCADIYAVSSIAKQNFNYYFHNRINGTLEYGIPDKATGDICVNRQKKLVFAVVGGVCPNKAQDLFIRAVGLLSEREKENAEFWLIGSIGEDEYSLKIRELARNEPKIKVFGLLTRTEMYEIYKSIDVVVCPSLEDCLPIVMTEGMMYAKICVVSDATGTADYIINGENGFICKKGDIDDLNKKIRWIIENREKTYILRKNARKTYEEYFTIDGFAERLEKVVLKSIHNYRKER